MEEKKDSSTLLTRYPVIMPTLNSPLPIPHRHTIFFMHTPLLPVDQITASTKMSSSFCPHCKHHHTLKPPEPVHRKHTCKIKDPCPPTKEKRFGNCIKKKMADKSSDDNNMAGCKCTMESAAHFTHDLHHDNSFGWRNPLPHLPDQSAGGIASLTQRGTRCLVLNGMLGLPQDRSDIGTLRFLHARVAMYPPQVSS